MDSEQEQIKMSMTQYSSGGKFIHVDYATKVAMRLLQKQKKHFEEQLQIKDDIIKKLTVKPSEL